METDLSCSCKMLLVIYIKQILLRVHYSLVYIRSATRLLIDLSSGGIVVRALTRDSKGRGFESRPFCFQLTTLGKLFTRMCLCHQTV